MASASVLLTPGSTESLGRSHGSKRRLSPSLHDVFSFDNSDELDDDDDFEKPAHKKLRGDGLAPLQLIHIHDTSTSNDVRKIHALFLFYLADFDTSQVAKAVEQCISLVVDIIPDVDPAHVRELANAQRQVASSEQLAAIILNIIMEKPDYPRNNLQLIKGKEKMKAPTSAVEIDCYSVDRECPTGQRYVDCALVKLTSRLGNLNRHYVNFRTSYWRTSLSSLIFSYGVNSIIQVVSTRQPTRP